MKDSNSKNSLDREDQDELEGSETLEEIQHETDASGGVTLRSRIASLLGSSLFEAVMTVLIISNMITIVLETDRRSDGGEVGGFLLFNRFLLFVYALELSMRMYIFRWSFVRNSMNLFESLIVAVDVIFEVLSASALKFTASLPPLQMFRAIRIVRMLRLLRVLSKSPELYVMLYSLAGAMKAVLWASVLVAYVITMWAVVAVEVLHPLNVQLVAEGDYDDCKDCGEAFSSVWAAALTFVRTIIAGDSWGDYSLTLITVHPWTGFILLGVLLTINLGILNLIMAVIVDRAEQARAEDKTHALKVKADALRKAKHRLLKLCRDLDTDGTGELTYDELLTGFHENEEAKKLFCTMDVSANDLHVVFSILDSDKSGSVNYHEFVEQFHKMTTMDSHTLLVFIRYYCQELRHSLANQVDSLINNVITKEDKLLERTLTRLHGSKHSMLNSLTAPPSPAGAAALRAVTSTLTPKSSFEEPHQLLRGISEHGEGTHQNLRAAHTTVEAAVEERKQPKSPSDPETLLANVKSQMTLAQQSLELLTCPDSLAIEPKASHSASSRAGVATFVHRIGREDLEVKSSAQPKDACPRTLDTVGCCGVHFARIDGIRATPLQTSTTS